MSCPHFIIAFDRCRDCGEVVPDPARGRDATRPRTYAQIMETCKGCGVQPDIRAHIMGCPEQTWSAPEPAPGPSLRERCDSLLRVLKSRECRADSEYSRGYYQGIADAAQALAALLAETEEP